MSRFPTFIYGPVTALLAGAATACYGGAPTPMVGGGATETGTTQASSIADGEASTSADTPTPPQESTSGETTGEGAEPTTTTEVADDTDTDGGASTSSGGGNAGELPPPSVGDIRWLIDGETTQWGDQATPHDGANRVGCLGANPQTALVSDQVPAYVGEYAVELRVEEAWPWGANNCSGGGKSRILLLSREINEINENEDLWMGWAVRVPGDWQAGQRAKVVLMHRGGYGPHYWIEVTQDLMWQLRGSNDIPSLSAGTDIAPVAPDQWHEFVTHSVLSPDADVGFIRVWHRLGGTRSWIEAVDYEGPTVAPDDVPNFGSFPVDAGFAITLAGGDWSGDGSVYVLHLDEMRVGGPDSSFDEVAPRSNVLIEL